MHADAPWPPTASTAAAITDVYPASGRPPVPVPLRSPEGMVGVTPDGLAFRVGRGPDAFRLVRWPAVRHVLPPVGDALTVYIARVGPVQLPRHLEPAIQLYRGSSYS